MSPVLDSDGNPVRDGEGQEQFVNPFSSDATRVWMTESESVKFGQFPAADLTPYTAAMASILEKISAVSALPGHFLGVTSSQPASADGLRAAEQSISSRALAKIRQYSPSWTRVAQLETAIRTGQNPDTVRVEPVWESPETRTPTQDADEFSKLVAGGVPLTVALSHVLGWTPDEVRTVEQARTSDAVASLLSAPAQPPAQPGVAA